MRVCPVCAEPVEGRKDKLYCSGRCRYAHQMQTAAEGSPFAGKGITKPTVGAISELKVSVDLMERGCHVFRALSSSCPCDLMALLPCGRAVRVEVKSATRYKGRLRHPKPSNDVWDVVAAVCGDEVSYSPDPFADALQRES